MGGSGDPEQLQLTWPEGRGGVAGGSELQPVERTSGSLCYTRTCVRCHVGALPTGRGGPWPGTSSTQPLDPPISPGRGPASPPTHTGSVLFVPLKCKLNSTWETAYCHLPANLVPQRHFGTFLGDKWEPRGGVTV